MNVWGGGGGLGVIGVAKSEVYTKCLDVLH